MVGTPCWAASMTASPQPSLRDGSTCTQLRCSTWCLVVVVDVAVERHRIGDAEQLRRARRAARPTSRRRGRRGAGRASAGRSRGDRVERVLDLLVRHQPRQHRHPRRRRPRRGQGLRGRLVEAVAHHRDAVGVHAEVGEIARRRQRHRHVLVAPVQPRRQRATRRTSRSGSSPGRPPATARGGSGAPARRRVGRTPAAPGTAARSGCRSTTSGRTRRSGPEPDPGARPSPTPPSTYTE